MLFWEALGVAESPGGDGRISAKPISNVQRLPFDRRCSATTKAGRRCRGQIREGFDFCVFHDPSLTVERRRRNAIKGGRSHHRLSHLPGGYLRKLTCRRAVGHAMDRLYRELRLGIVTPEMASVLFSILTRIMDSGLCDGSSAEPRSSGRSRAERLRPKLRSLLTHAEHRAWRRAVRNAPAAFLRNSAAAGQTGAVGPIRDVALPAAS